jgi:branched-chain amino acid transport system substrate-binding protein
MKILRNCVVACFALAAAGGLAACGSSSSGSSSSSSSSGGGGGAKASTITIGASLSLSGDFASDGQAFQRGYQLWADA